jgi:hypothetical protein
MEGDARYMMPKNPLDKMRKKPETVNLSIDLSEEKYEFAESVESFFNTNEEELTNQIEEFAVRLYYLWLRRGFHLSSVGSDVMDISLNDMIQCFSSFCLMLEDIYYNKNLQVLGIEDITKKLEEIKNKKFDDITEEEICDLYATCFYLWKSKKPKVNE